jgi:hypothetical protein
MKTKMHSMRVSFWVILGIAIIVTNLALIRPTSLYNSTAPPVAQTGTIVATQEAQSEVGSTDGIMIVAVVIVLIVIIPILLMRRSWENGKENRKTPPSRGADGSNNIPT